MRLNREFIACRNFGVLDTKNSADSVLYNYTRYGQYLYGCALNSAAFESTRFNEPTVYVISLAETLGTTYRTPQHHLTTELTIQCFTSKCYIHSLGLVDALHKLF